MTAFDVLVPTNIFWRIHNTSMQLEFLRQGHLLLVQHNEFASFQNLRNYLVQHPF